MEVCYYNISEIYKREMFLQLAGCNVIADIAEWLKRLVCNSEVLRSISLHGVLGKYLLFIARSSQAWGGGKHEHRWTDCISM